MSDDFSLYKIIQYQCKKVAFLYENHIVEHFCWILDNFLLKWPEIFDHTLSKYYSMTTLMEHSCAHPRECSFLPKKLMLTNNFFIGLVFSCAWYDKNRALF